MPPPRKGSVSTHGDHYDVRVRLVTGALSPRIHLEPGLTHEQAQAEALELQREYDREQTRPAAPVGGPTLDAWAELWFADRERRGLTSVLSDRSRWRKWVSPRLGARPIAVVTTTELEAFVEYLDEVVRGEEIAAQTASNIWVLLSQAFDDAAHAKTLALRTRPNNPAAGVRKPDSAPARSKAYLYPSEVLRLLSCAEVPVAFRRAVAVAVYLYLRTAEHRALTWAAVDEERRVVLVHESEDRDGAKKSTKGRRARRVPIEPPLVPLLQAMRAEGGELGAELAGNQHMPRSLRRWLLRAGVTREELHVSTKDKTRKPMTWHDLRATGLTWCAIRGDEPLRIMARAGHTDLETTMLYVREAEVLRDGFGEVFPALPLEALGVVGSEQTPSAERGVHSGSSQDRSRWEQMPSSKEGGSVAGSRFALVDSAAIRGVARVDATEQRDTPQNTAAAGAVNDPRGRAVEALAAALPLLLGAGEPEAARLVSEALALLLRPARGADVANDNEPPPAWRGVWRAAA